MVPSHDDAAIFEGFDECCGGRWDCGKSLIVGELVAALLADGLSQLVAIVNQFDQVSGSMRESKSWGRSPHLVDLSSLSSSCTAATTSATSGWRRGSLERLNLVCEGDVVILENDQLMPQGSHLSKDVLNKLSGFRTFAAMFTVGGLALPCWSLERSVLRAESFEKWQQLGIQCFCLLS